MEIAVISVIVPTRNRAHTLQRVAPSYFALDGVDEILFAAAAGTDDAAEVVTRITAEHPGVHCRVLRNAQRLGASQSHNVGVQACHNDVVLFCDDDEYLERGYARTCLAKLEKYGAGAVSGQRVYMREGEGETPAQALLRGAHGLRRAAPFRPMLCEYVNGARFEGDRRQPITNPVMLTRRALLLRHPFDGHYARGNGYREETDYQMNLFVSGHDIWVTNNCHSIHLSLSQMRSGQRTSAWRRIYWENHYTRYFFGKYAAYARRLGLATPRVVALAGFFVFSLYRELLRPGLARIALALLDRRARLGASPAR